VFFFFQATEDVVLERLFNILFFDHAIFQTRMLMNEVVLKIFIAAREYSLSAKIRTKVIGNAFGDDLAVESFLFVCKSSNTEVSKILVIEELLARISLGLEIFQLQVQLTLNVLSLILGIVESCGSRHAF